MLMGMISEKGGRFIIYLGEKGGLAGATPLSRAEGMGNTKG